MSTLRGLGLVSLLALSPAWAWADVPAIQDGVSATASAAASAQATSQPTIVNQPGAQKTAIPPAGWPPATAVIKPPHVVLDHKEAAAAAQSAAWRNRSDRPTMDPTGTLHWVFGNSQPRVVCSPLNLCDIAMQPGETINDVHIGDTAFWATRLSVSSGPEGRTTHLTLSPLQEGHETSMLVYTNRRTYSIKLVSAAKSYTALTAFTYPDAQDSLDASLAAYHAKMGGKKVSGTMSMVSSDAGDIARIEMLKISGDNPSWKPVAAYTDGKKTYIQFPSAMQFSDSPTLLGVNNDGGFFSSATERRVIYRWMGDRLIADTVMNKLELVLGVGSNRSSVILTRGSK